MLTDIIQASVNLFDSIGNGMMGLALSPFARMEQLAIDNTTIYMLNWVFPLNEAVALLYSWGSSIAAWYLFKYVKKHYQDALNGITGVGGMFGKKGV